MKTVALKIIVLLAIYAATNPAIATTFLNTKSPSFEVDTVYNDDVFISGARIKFDSRVNGDLVSLTYEMVQTDTIYGNFMALAYSVQNLGPVMGSYRAAGRIVSCNSDIGRNVLIAAQDINVGPASHIGRDADLAGASVVYQGDVKGNLKITSRMAIVSGHVTGNLIFKGDSLTINPNTIIDGGINYTSPVRVTIAPGAVITGKVNWEKEENVKPQEQHKGNFWTTLTWGISLRGYFIIMAIISILVIIPTLIPSLTWISPIVLWFILAVSGNVLILLARPKALAAQKILEARLFPSMGLGFIIFFLTPIIVMILFFTIIASPLAIILLMLFGVAMFAGGIIASLYVGRRICKIFSPASTNTPGFLCFTIGMSIILALSLIPILGYLLILVTLMSGLGGLAQTYLRNKTELVSDAAVEAKP
jgi:cytoskeletal protein CcmA (bactofilin family)